MWPRELARYLGEARHWGYNGYGDWLTAFDLGSPYAPGLYSSLAIELYDRKKAAFRAASSMGMRLDLIACPNLVYLDQLRSDLVAEKSPKMLGQLLCPSKPEARAIILDNFDRQFRDLAEHDVALGSWTAFAYDFGGCACDRCAPWILTFAGLTREVRDVARRHFPAIETRVATWWWDDEEYRRFGDWVSQHEPGLCDTTVRHIRYGAVRMDEGDLPDGCRRLAFLHLGYGDVAGNGDIYAKFGAVVAPRRLPDTLATVAAQGATGFLAYSEGVFDDLNKAIAGALALFRSSKTPSL